MDQHKASGTSVSDLSWTTTFFGLLAALLVFRLVSLGLNNTDLFFDEAQYWSWSRDPALGYYSKPPLIAWLIRAATDVCGSGEFCVRLPSPLIHTATSSLVFLLASRLYDARTGALAGLAFATLPGVSLSTGIISTDVPLLFAWALGLLALHGLFETRAVWPALVLGAAIGIGLNAKYAMGFFGLCFGIYLGLTPRRRSILADPRLYAGLALGLALIAPNLYWNATNGFATFSHTADNANWQGPGLNPLKALEFFGAQFGVFGPILFSALLVVCWRAAREKLPEADRLLLAFSVPVIAVMTIQSGLSRAHANWAAVAYVGATVLVTAHLVRAMGGRWYRTSIVLHLALALTIALGTALAGRLSLPAGADPLSRTLGWRAMAEATREVVADARSKGRPFAAIVADQRAVAAELLYYLRDDPTPVLAWRAAGPPRDHFEMTRPFQAGSGEPVLLVSLKDAELVTRAFETVTEISARQLPAGPSTQRRVTFYDLSGYHPQ